MTEIVFAFNAISSSSDRYLGTCRVKDGDSIFGALQDALKEATGEEYAYLESVDLYTDNLEYQDQCRGFVSLLVKDFQRAYELEQ
jgi:hypothetical protein